MYEYKIAILGYPPSYHFSSSSPPPPLDEQSGLDVEEESASESERSKSGLAPSGQSLRLPSVLCLWALHLVAAASAFPFLTSSL